MKRKILPFLMVMMFLATSTFAQKQVSVSEFSTQKVEMQKKGSRYSTPDNSKEVAGTISAVTANYTAGTTVDLEFKYNHSSPDLEYTDGVSIDFPAGIVVNSATACTETGAELAYNSETGDGAVVSWGNMSGGSGFGDLSADGTFKVNVTIGGSFSGDMSLTWNIVGDGYGSAPHTKTGSFVIPELVDNDLAVTAITPSFIVSGTSATPVVTVDNSGGNAQNSYDVTVAITDASTGASIHNETKSFTDNIASGASFDCVMDNEWTTPADGTYSITATVALTGDGNSQNDALVQECLVGEWTTENFDASTNLPAGWVVVNTNSDHTWSSEVVTAPHSSPNSLYLHWETSNVQDDWVITCGSNLISGKTYKINFWVKMPGYSGTPDEMGFYVGTSQGVADLNTNLWNSDGLMTTDWTLIEATYTPSSTGVYYFGWHANTPDHNVNSMYLDDASITEIKDNDLAVTAITPNYVEAGETYSPTVVVKNNGALAQTTYDVSVYTEDGTYSQTQEITAAIAPGATYNVTGFQWENVPLGTYTLTAVVTLAGDEKPSNDEMSIVFNAVEFGNYAEGTIYAFDVADWTGSGFENHIVNVNTGDATMTDVGATGVSSMYCGDFIDGKLYGIVDNEVYCINGSGFVGELGTISGLTGASGLAWDVDGDAVYVSTTTDLYTIDGNLNATKVGTYTATTDGMIGIASDLDGNLYGVSLDDNLYSINKATGIPTLIGALGINIQYAQDIGYDRTNDVLYGTFYLGSGTGGLYTINVGTGVATQVGSDFGDELSVCAVFYEKTYTTTITVNDGTNPIEGALVDIDGGTYTATTNASGVAVFYLPEDDYTLDVSKYMYTSHSGSFSVSGTYSETVTLDRMYTSTFTINDGTDPIEGALVDIDNGTYTATTDASGDVDFVLTSGDHDVQVTKSLYEPYNGGFTVGTETYTETISLDRTYTVSFTVTDAISGDPIAGVDIDTYSQTYTTNVDGMVEGYMLPGTYTYTATEGLHFDATGSYTVTTYTNTVNFTMDPMQTYTVTFNVKEQGTTTNVENAMVYAKDWNGNPYSGPTDVDGNVEFDMLSGDGATYSVTALGYFDIAETSYSVTATYSQTVNIELVKQSDDATLASLSSSIGTLAPDFASGTYSYTVEVPYGTTNVPTLTYSTTNSEATTIETEATSLPGISTILVTAEDGVTQLTYSVTFIIAPNDDATLSDLTYDGTTVPGFDAATYIYTVELPYGKVPVPIVVGTPTDANATAVTTDAAAVPGTSTVLVTAEDGVTQLTYSVTFTVAPANDDATLSDLTVDGTTVTGFDAATYTYTVELAAGTTTVPTVVGTPTDANATVVNTDATALPGTTTLLVTAEDGITTSIYTVNFTVAEAINEVNANVAIGPNPTNGMITITADANYKVTVFDITGKVISMTEMNNNSTVIDITNEEAGMYIVILSNEKGTSSYKVIKK